MPTSAFHGKRSIRLQKGVGAAIFLRPMFYTERFKRWVAAFQCPKNAPIIRAKIKPS